MRFARVALSWIWTCGTLRSRLPDSHPTLRYVAEAMPGSRRRVAGRVGTMPGTSLHHSSGPVVTASHDGAPAPAGPTAGVPVVGVVMGSASDYDTLAPACETLAELGIPYEARVVSAHRTPDWLFEYASTASG